MDIESLRFLVVEDQGFQRWAVQRMLQDLGARYVYAAEDGKSALETMESLEGPVDIVLSDLDMPGMDGMEFIRRLAQDGRRVSLVLLSGQAPGLLATVESMATAYGVKVLAAIPKPATPQKLREALEGFQLHRPGFPAEGAREEYPVDEMRAALRDGDIRPFLQAKVDVLTGRLAGAEALARWVHPSRGVIAARDFVPRLERGGLITDLALSVLRASCEACVQWRRAGARATVAVNISVASLTEVGIADRFIGIVEETGATPSDVVLELTETAATSDLGTALENLSRLRMRGFGLSIDDYGTGYSSMQQLTRVPFTELKIDQSFVLRAHDHAPSRAMLESSLELANKLRIPSVAEGVETDREWRLVRDMGCNLAQGFFVGRPLPIEEFIATMPREA